MQVFAPCWRVARSSDRYKRSVPRERKRKTVRSTRGIRENEKSYHSVSEHRSNRFSHYAPLIVLTLLRELASLNGSLRDTALATTRLRTLRRVARGQGDRKSRLDVNAVTRAIGRHLPDHRSLFPSSFRPEPPRGAFSCQRRTTSRSSLSRSFATCRAARTDLQRRDITQRISRGASELQVRSTLPPRSCTTNLLLVANLRERRYPGFFLTDAPLATRFLSAANQMELLSIRSVHWKPVAPE